VSPVASLSSTELSGRFRHQFRHGLQLPYRFAAEDQWDKGTDRHDDEYRPEKDHRGARVRFHEEWRQAAGEETPERLDCSDQYGISSSTFSCGAARLSCPKSGGGSSYSNGSGSFSCPSSIKPNVLGLGRVNTSPLRT
jgi:hypothetical protein